MGFSPSDAAFEGFRLTRRAPLAVLAWVAVYLVGAAIIFGLAGGSLLEFIAVAEGVGQSGEPTDAEMMRFMQAYFGFIGLLLPLSLVMNTVLTAAIHRAVLRPQERAFGYLRLGMDELRVFVVSLVLSILFVVIATVTFVAVGIGVAATTAGAGENSGLAVLLGLLLGAVGMALMIWLAVRLCLALPITVAERRLAIFDSWRLTRGRVWSLIGMSLLAFVMALVVAILLSIITWPVMMIMGFSGLAGLESMTEFEPARLLRDFGPMIVVYGVFTSISAVLQNVVLYAPFSAAYQGLKRD